MSKPKYLHNNRIHSQIQIIISGFGFFIILPHLCGMPTASVSTSFHSIFKSKWAENVDFHMWRASILILVKRELPVLLSCEFRNPITFWALITVVHMLESLRCPINYRRGLTLLLVPLALATHSTLLLMRSWLVGLNRSCSCPLWWGQSGGGW